MNPRAMSPAEAAVMEGLMPGRVAESTAVLALCLYEALVLGDARAGTKKPAGEWQQQLEAWAHQVIDQIRHVSAELGGFSKYLAKNQGIWLSERDQAIWNEFAGDYQALAQKYDLTEMRVRQIIATARQAEVARRQGKLALDDEG